MSGLVSAPREETARRKPSVAARRVSLFEREIRVHLGTAAIELLFSRAEVLSEGQRQGARYFGSTMITLDLDKARGALREPCDAADAKRVALLLEKDTRVQARVRGIATGAAAARAGGPFVRLDAEVRVRAAGSRVHVDIDVEGFVS